MSTAASLIAEIRSDSGLSQRSLAKRAGVPVSTVSRIEAGEMDPTITMLSRVVSAAGRQLDLGCIERPELPSIARLTDAWFQTQRGPSVDWTRLRGFLDWLRLHPELVTDAIAAPPARTGFDLLDNLLAGIAEKVADDAGTTRPRWCSAVPPLHQPWLPPGTPRMNATSEAAAPDQFKKRNVFIAVHDLWRQRG